MSTKTKTFLKYFMCAYLGFFVVFLILISTGILLFLCLSTQCSPAQPTSSQLIHRLRFSGIDMLICRKSNKMYTFLIQREIKKKFMTTWVNVNSRRQTRASRVSHIMHIETDTLTDSCMHKQVCRYFYLLCLYLYNSFFLYELVGKRKRYCDAKIHFICQLKIRPANLQPDYNYMNYINICLAFVTHTRMWLPTCMHMCICMCMRTQAYVDQV